MKHLWCLPTAADTGSLGSALGQAFRWSDQQASVIFLRGELGAGKTTLAAALLCALGVEEVVRSPSYALVETYALRAGVAVHIDLYRLLGVHELEQIGIRDYLNSHTLLLIEWPERAEVALPAPDLDLRLSVRDTGRNCHVAALSSAGEAWLAAVERYPSTQI